MPKTHSVQTQKVKFEKVRNQRIGGKDSRSCRRGCPFKPHFVKKAATRNVIETTVRNPQDRHLGSRRNGAETHSNRRFSEKLVIRCQDLDRECRGENLQSIRCEVDGKDRSLVF